MTVQGRLRRTAASNAPKYNSRNVAGSTTASTTMRLASWLLTAKCFSEAPTPSPCTPSIQATANSPARNGSSEKYSKFRPAAG